MAKNEAPKISGARGRNTRNRRDYALAAIKVFATGGLDGDFAEQPPVDLSPSQPGKHSPTTKEQTVADEERITSPPRIFETTAEYRAGMRSFSLVVLAIGIVAIQTAIKNNTPIAVFDIPNELGNLHTSYVAATEENLADVTDRLTNLITEHASELAKTLSVRDGTKNAYQHWLDALNETREKSKTVADVFNTQEAAPLRSMLDGIGISVAEL